MDKNLATLFQNRVYRHRNAPLFGSKTGTTWQWMSWNEAAAWVERAGRALLAIGIQPQDKVAILSENRVEWALADLAIQSIGGVTVPIYTTSAPDQVSYILEHSEAKCAFVSDLPSNPTFRREIHAKIMTLPSLARVVAFDLISDHAAEPRWSFWEDFLENAKEVPPKDFYARIEGIGSQSISTIIYTSGTTGHPKGVLLSHFNIVSNCHNGCKALPADENDTTLSFLPLSHAFERTGGFYGMLNLGARIAYAQSIATIGQDIQETHPTILFAVPRILEKIHASIWDEVGRRARPVRMAFNHALALADRKNSLGVFDRFMLGVYHKIFFSKVLARLGGKTRFIISGGAKLNPKIATFFDQIGIPVYQGYGLTETSPVVSVNGPGKNKIGSVGQPIHGVDVSIAEDGEILVRGAPIMKGYYKDETATRAVMDANGYFHTGDIGHLDEEGYLFVTDRKKELIVTSGGKKIPPQTLENLLQESPWIEQACVVGEGQKFLAAIVVPSKANLRKHFESSGRSFPDDATMIGSPETYALIQDAIDRANHQLAAYETIKKFVVSMDDFTVDNGRLTPTLKLKRKNILEAYVKEIDSIYSGT